MKESDFQNQIIDLARMFGWKIAHFRPAFTSKGYRTPVQGDGAGYPDCCLVKGRRLIFAELKRSGGKLSEKQQEWLEVLKASCRAEVYVWYPEDFEKIVEILQREDI